MVRSVTADGLRYRPQIPLSDLHQKKVQRAEEAIVEKVVEEEAAPSEEELSLEEYPEEKAMVEETSVTIESTTRHMLKKKFSMKKGPKKEVQIKRQKPICGAEPFSSLDISCEQPTTCKPVEENIADLEDGEIQTTCNTVGTTKTKRIIVTSGILRERQIKSKTKDDTGNRAQKPIRAEVKEVKKKEQKEVKVTRRPLRKKKRRLPLNRHRQNQGLKPVFAVHYSGEFSSTSTYAPYPSGFTPQIIETPYENYHCGQIAHCVIRPWDAEPTLPTTTVTYTTSTTEAIGREGKDKEEEEEYELSDYKFQ